MTSLVIKFDSGLGSSETVFGSQHWDHKITLTNAYRSEMVTHLVDDVAI